jgi:hypothetical protein
MEDPGQISNKTRKYHVYFMPIGLTGLTSSVAIILRSKIRFGAEIKKTFLNSMEKSYIFKLLL